MFRIATIAWLIATFLAASGCGGGSGSGSQSNQAAGGLPQGSTSSVVVTPATANVYQGMTTRFQAQVVGESDQTVTWSVEKDGLGTIDSAGLYTAPLDASGGAFHVVATSHAVPSANGSATVTVLVPQVTIAPATVTLAPGGIQTFTATTGTDLIWCCGWLDDPGNLKHDRPPFHSSYGD